MRNGSLPGRVHLVELRIFGEGSDVIVLHGSPVPPTSVEPVYEALADSHRVIVPNLHDLRVDTVTTLEWLEEALRSHGITSAAAVGHSLGAYCAFQLADSGGIDITRIAALSSLAYMPADVLAGYQELARAVEADAIDIAEVLLDQWFSPDFLASNPAVSELVRRWFDELGKDGILATVRVAGKIPDLRPALPQLSLPVYLRVGDCDLATPEAWSREIAGLLPNARLDVVEGAGHFLQFEDCPEATNTFVRTRTFYRDDYLARFDVQKTVAVPLQIGDELRAVFFDGPRFLGWIGINRRGQSERFRATEERALRRAKEQIKSVLTAADALESKNLEGGVYAVCTPDGVIEHASISFKRWLTAERTQYLRQRVQALDSAGPCGAGPEFHDGAEVHIVRLDGTANVGYLATLTGVAHLRLCPRDWLTPRQLEIAEHAAAGATASEIAHALDISPHTVKFHLKNIYQRLQVASRLELAAILAS